MLGWSIIARACRSASKRAMTCVGVHARLDDLQGDLAADGLRSARPRRRRPCRPRRSAPAACRGRSPCRALGVRRIGGGRVDGRARGRDVEEAVARRVGREQALDPRPRSPASPPQACVEVGGPLARASALDGVAEDRHQLVEARGRASIGSSLRAVHRPVRPVCDAESAQRRRGIIFAARRPAGVGARRSGLAEPGAGVGPVAVGGPRRDAEGLGGLLDGQPGEEAELDQLGRRRVVARRGRSRASSRASRSSGGPLDGDRDARRGRRAAGRRRASGRRLRRALSTRMRRMASAAAAKKWPRLSQCPGLLATDQPEVRLVDQGRGLERLARASPAPAAGRPACAARRRPAAGAARPLRVALLDGREDAGHVVHRHGFPRSVRRAPPVRSRCSAGSDPGRCGRKRLITSLPLTSRPG